MGVRDRWARDAACRGTGAFSEGPSTSTCICEFPGPQNRSSGRRTYALVIDDLDDGRQTSVVRASAEEDDTAELDLPPLGSCDAGVTHFDKSC